MIPLNERISLFVVEWTKFPIDLWWRKKYNIPFGSKAHREMNFIDMAIEYQETLQLNKIANGISIEPEYQEEEEFIDSQLQESDKKIVNMTQTEIDKDYDEIDLENFNV